MGSLAERLDQLKAMNANEVSSVAHEIREIVQNMPMVDTQTIRDDLSSILLTLFNSQNAIDEDRKNKIFNSLSKQEDAQKAIAEKQGDIISEQEKLMRRLAEVESALKTAVKGIKPTDVSGVEKAVKAIKPTDISKLQGGVEYLSEQITMLANKKTPKVPKTDLKPVLDAINKPKKKTVVFELETDAYGFPLKVIATES